MFELGPIDLAVLILIHLVVEILEITVPVLMLVDLLHVGDVLIDLFL